MIRQLRRLTRPVARAGPRASALAVYANARGNDKFELRPAAEQGFEGVACVDDAARAAVLYCEIWRRHRLPWASEAAQGVLRFVTYMQGDDGRFVNFILNWDGLKNLSGVTSRPGGWWWTSRAMHALAAGVTVFGGTEYIESFERGLPWLDRPCPYLDVRAVCVLACLEYWAATGKPAVAERALSWSEEIAASRLGDLLPDMAGEPNIHLWGHLQEVALVRAALAFDRPDLARVAQASADAVLVSAVDRAFTAPTTIPFDVSCTIHALTAVAEVTRDVRYATRAVWARAWFVGRNAARQPIYDRRRGLVYDGIDDGLVNGSSGAESNVEGALALLDWVPWNWYDGSSCRILESRRL